MGTSKSILTYDQRREILDAISATVTKHFYDRHVAETEWPQLLRTNRELTLDSSSDEDFETRIMRLLSGLKSSHVGFYHAGLSRCSAKMALCATYSAFPFEDSERWVFQDVHEGGPAAKAGIRPGDILTAVDGREYVPPEHPLFSVSSEVAISTLTSELCKETRRVSIPSPVRKSNQLPYVIPDPVVSQKKLNHETGYIRIAMYPGEIGVDVANQITNAIDGLSGIRRLIIDLRGNTGGGVAFLRVLSLLTPDRLPVGLFQNGKLTRSDSLNSDAIVFDHIPSKKYELYWLALKFGSAGLLRKLRGKKSPVLVATEGLGGRAFHGRTVILVDRHTASANEMLVSFSKEHKLAVIVGEATPGRVLAGGKFKLPHKYWIALPVGSFQTSEGKSIEGQPIEPDLLIPFDPVTARDGLDVQLEKAVAIVADL